MAFAGDTAESCAVALGSPGASPEHLLTAASAQQQRRGELRAQRQGPGEASTTSPGCPCSDSDSSESFLWGVWLKTRRPPPATHKE